MRKKIRMSTYVLIRMKCNGGRQVDRIFSHSPINLSLKIAVDLGEHISTAHNFFLSGRLKRWHYPLFGPWSGLFYYPDDCTNCFGVSGIHASYVVFPLQRVQSRCRFSRKRQNNQRTSQAIQRERNTQDLPGQLAAFGINGNNVKSLFMSHPPLEERIAALQNIRL